MPIRKDEPTHKDELFCITYPENRCVPWSQIYGWYLDAVANLECTPGLSGRNAMQALEDAGLVTFAPHPANDASASPSDYRGVD